MERSVNCFWRGVIGFVPVLGIPFAIMGLIESLRVLISAEGAWNPAERYRFWGGVISCLALLLNLIIVLIILANIAHATGVGWD